MGFKYFGDDLCLKDWFKSDIIYLIINLGLKYYRSVDIYLPDKNYLFAFEIINAGW